MNRSKSESKIGDQRHVIGLDAMTTLSKGRPVPPAGDRLGQRGRGSAPDDPWRRIA
jgi:hypothetical protein